MSETAQTTRLEDLRWDEYRQVIEARNLQIEQFRLATEREIVQLLQNTHPDSVAGFFARIFKQQRVRPVKEVEEIYYETSDLQSRLSNSIVNAKNSAPFKHARLTIESAKSKPDSYALLATNNPNGLVNILNHQGIPEHLAELHEKARILAAECVDHDTRELIKSLYQAYFGKALDISPTTLVNARLFLEKSGITICRRNGIAILAKCNTNRFSQKRYGEIETPILIIANETSAFSQRETTPQNTAPNSPESVKVRELQKKLDELEEKLAATKLKQEEQAAKLDEMARLLQQAEREKALAEAIAADYYSRLNSNGHKTDKRTHLKKPRIEEKAVQAAPSTPSLQKDKPQIPVPTLYTTQNIAISPIPTRVDADRAIRDIALAIIKDPECITRDELSKIVDTLSHVKNQPDPSMRTINDYLTILRTRILSNAEMRGTKLQEHRGVIMRTKI